MKVVSTRREDIAADLSKHWKITFGNSGTSADADHLASWSDNPATRFFSGQARYEKAFAVQADQMAGGARFFLDFGPPRAEPVPPANAEHTMQAYLDPPIREAAEVFVNGKRAGVVWHPPYRVEVTAYLKEGANDLRVVVGNTALNEMAGQTCRALHVAGCFEIERYLSEITCRLGLEADCK